MPNGMGGTIQAIVIGRNVFVGGGGGRDETTVMVYSLETETWSTLPPYQRDFFGMSAVDSKLVLVGGRSTLTDIPWPTGMLGVWDEQSQTWTHPFPAMPTARRSPSVISYQKWLVVAGGSDGRGFYYKSVEILDTISGQWYEGSPLPIGCSSMSSAVNRNMWYRLGGYTSRGASKQVFSVCLDKLVSQAVARSASTTSLSTPSLWHTHPDTPLQKSTALILNGALLAVGGKNSSAIHLYQPSSGRWVKAGDLPNQLNLRHNSAILSPFQQMRLTKKFVYNYKQVPLFTLCDVWCVCECVCVCMYVCVCVCVCVCISE